MPKCPTARVFIHKRMKRRAQQPDDPGALSLLVIAPGTAGTTEVILSELAIVNDDNTQPVSLPREVLNVGHIVDGLVACLNRGGASVFVLRMEGDGVVGQGVAESLREVVRGVEAKVQGLRVRWYPREQE
jgi:hypothetical protein